MIIKKALVTAASLAIVIAASTTIASAAEKTTRHNTGNSVMYGKSLDMSLGTLTVTNGPDGTFTTHHYVNLNGGNVTWQAYSSRVSSNNIEWYAEVRENDGSGPIEKSYSTTYPEIENGKEMSSRLSKGMGLFTGDKKVTYCRVDVYPYSKSSSIQKAYKALYRRASTDIRHDD